MLTPRTIATATGSRPENLVRLAAFSAVLALTISSFASLSALCLVMATVLAIATIARSRARGFSRTQLYLATYYGLYLAVGTASGGYILSLDALQTEMRWIPGVVYCAAVSMMSDRHGWRYLYQVRTAGAASCGCSLASIAFHPEALRSGHELWGLSSSHHVPGAIAGMTLVLAYQLPRRPTSIAGLIGVGCAAATLLLSQSRISLLAVVIVGAWSALRVSRHRDRAKHLAAIAALIVVVTVMNSRTRETIVWLSQPETLASLSESLDKGTEQGTAVEGPLTNVTTRFALYGQALRDFRSHWLVGLGPGRFNDRAEHPNRKLSSAPWLPAQSELQNVNSELTAHNIYIHTAVELGLVGLIPLGLLTRRLVTGRDATPAGRYLIVLGLTSTSLLSIAATVPLLGVAVLGGRLQRRPAAEPASDVIDLRAILPARLASSA